MSLFSFIKKTKSSNSRYSLVLNISSGSVSGAILSFTEKPGTNILAYHKEVFSMNASKTADRQIKQMQTSLRLLVNKLQADGIKKTKGELKIGNVYYVFCSPWSVSQTKLIRISEIKPFKVSPVYIQKIINTNDEKFKSTISIHGQTIEKKIIQLKIDGYVVNNSTSKLARDLELSVLYTVVPDNILAAVESIVEKSFIVKENVCHSLSLAIFSVIRDLYSYKSDFLYIDVNEEMTSIVLVKDGVIASEASVPFGRNKFVAGLASKSNVTESIADSLLRMDGGKDMNPDATLGVKVALENIAGDWINYISDILRHFGEKIFLPETLFLIINPDLMSLFINKLKAQDFEVLIIDKYKVELPKGQEDIILKITLIFLDKLYKI